TDNSDWPEDVPAALGTLGAGHAFVVPEVMFAKITDEQSADWRNRFSGTRQ
ncbi:MAG: hypothetical protein ACC631_05985, partial [Halocynthiibacter sp.]